MAVRAIKPSLLPLLKNLAHEGKYSKGRYVGLEIAEKQRPYDGENSSLRINRSIDR